MCRSRETCLSAKCFFLCASTNTIQLSVLVQYKADIIILLSTCNPFSPCIDQLKHCSLGTTQRSLTKDLYVHLNERRLELPTLAFYLLIEMVFVFLIFYCTRFLVYNCSVMKNRVFLFNLQSELSYFVLFIRQICNYNRFFLQGNNCKIDGI